MLFRSPAVSFIVAHIGGGGDYQHTFHALAGAANVVVDLSGSGVDRGMLDGALNALSSQRILFGTDLTMETGLAKLRALDATGLCTADDIADIRWRNAVRLFGAHAFPA